MARAPFISLDVPGITYTLGILLCIIAPLSAVAENSLQNADIGNVTAEGGASFQGEHLHVQGSGSGIAQAGDSFHFVWQVNRGDFALKSRIAPGVGAEGALVVRESEMPTARGLWLGFNQSGKIILFTRATKGGALSRAEFDADGPAPVWLQVTRSGDRFDLASSEDGLVWTAFHQSTLALPDLTAVGFGAIGADVVFEQARVLAVQGPAVTNAKPGTLEGTGAMQNEVQTPASSVDSGSNDAGHGDGKEKAPDAPQPPPVFSGPRLLYVNKSLGNDLNDGFVSLKSGVKGPKKTIQAAMDLARDGDTIVISGGTYDIGEAFSGSGNRSVTIQPVGEVIF